MFKADLEGADILIKRLDEYSKSINQEAGESIKDIARIGSKQLAHKSFPAGTNGKTKDILTKAIYKDIIKAYSPQDSSTVTDDGAYLESLRNTRGRVPTNSKKKVISRESYETIKKNKIKVSGMAKAGWLQAGDGVGTKKSRVPAWLRKLLRLGRADVQSKGWQTTVILTNEVSYADRLITEAQIKQSIGAAFKNHLSYIERKMKKLADKL